MSEGGVGNQENASELYRKQENFLKFIKTNEKKSNLNSQASKEKKSLSHGGKSLEIKGELGRGVTDPKKIAENLGFSTAQIADARKTLRNWNIELPQIRRNYDELQKTIGVENDDVKLQSILNSFTMESITGFMRNNKDQTMFVNLGNSLRESGFVGNAKTVGDRLRKNGIPVGEYSRVVKGKEKPLVTWVVYDKHKQRISGVAEEMFKSGELKKSPK
jgi:hypothetical protein